VKYGTAEKNKTWINLGSNTGDNATNTQYSDQAALITSLQDQISASKKYFCSSSKRSYWHTSGKTTTWM
jgi:hypothetical protein